MTFSRAGRPQRSWIDAIAPKRVGRHVALSNVALSACSIVGIRSGTEERRFTVLQTQGPLESASMVHGSQPKTEVTGN